MSNLSSGRAVVRSRIRSEKKPTDRCVTCIRLALSLVLGLALVAGQVSGAETDPDVAALRQEMEAMRKLYEQRLAELEDRIHQLEAERPTRPAAAGETTTASEIERLRAAARDAAGVAPGATTDAPGAVAGDREPTIGHERNLNRLNPEISFTGDVLARSDGSDHDIDAREFELDLQATLDPFSHTKWTLAYREEGVEIEEGYIGWTAVAPGLGLRVGKMRQSFGALNRYHLHALPQVEYPLALRTYFSDEGLGQTGASLEWLAPRPWASANELTVQVTDGSNEAFGGESFDRLAVLLHLKNFWDVSPSTWFEWGLSGIHGSPESGRDTRVWGTDLTLHWQPPSRAKYRELTWRTEILFSQRDDTDNVRHDAWGGYTYLEGLLRRNLYAGLLYERVEDPLDPTILNEGLEPYVSWWQSEYVRLRLAYRTFRNNVTDDTDHRFDLQVTWAAGPHKHEHY